MTPPSSQSDGPTQPSFDLDEHPLNTPKELPQSIGRYEVVQCIANGGQCSVLLAHDPRLNRTVAIKVPRVTGTFDEELYQQFLHEARSVVPLKHKSIIQVLDVAKTDDGLPYVVLEYVDGEDLHTYWKNRKFDLSEVLRIIQQIVTGLDFIHSHSTVHRDLKPSNIMIDQKGNVRIADFGLAMKISEENRNKTVAGTTRFMSPEQLRGENDKIKQQADIWGIGVILYWMCAGEYPFVGDSIIAQQKLIDKQEHPHLNDCNSAVPIELDRICRKCLSESPENRYWDAPELLKDIGALAFELNGTDDGSSDDDDASDKLPTQIHDIVTGPTYSHKIVPKGLLAFDAADSEFYLDLMPEPRDRHGIPDSLRFWLSRFRGPLSTSPVNLLSGSKGCGKTSLLRAGLIPRLPTSTATIYVECDPFQTEAELVEAIRDSIAHTTEIYFRPGCSLDEALTEICNGEAALVKHQRVLIVLDQFEQWLANAENFSAKNYSASELARALRLCDGDRLSCLISVRDDFWFEATEFLELIGGKLQEGKNAKAMPDLTLQHAANVLCEIGHAYSCFPDSNQESPINISRAAVEILSPNRVVNCGHLSVLASVLKKQQWTRETLDNLESWEHCLSQFLNDQLTSETAHISNRRLIPQVECIIGELVRTLHDRTPQGTSDLIEACPTGTSQMLFQDSIRLLEQDFRFISIVPSPKSAADGPTGENFYRLSHPALVQPLENWLTANGQMKQSPPLQKALNELSSAWAERDDSRFFPSLPMLFQMKWNSGNLVVRESQATYLKRATQYWALKASSLALVLAVLSGTIFSVFSNLKKEQNNKDLYHNYLNCDIAQVSTFLDEILAAKLDLPSIVEATSYNDSPSVRLRHELALCQNDSFSDVATKSVLELASKSPANESSQIAKVLSERVSITETTDLLKTLAKESTDRDIQLKLAVMAFELGDNSLVESYLQAANGDPTYLVHLRHRFKDLSVISADDLARRAISESTSTNLKLLIMTILLQADEPYSSLDQNLRFALIGIARDVYQSSSCRNAHSISKWALRRSSVELPEINQNLESDDKLDYQWRCLRQGLTLIEVLKEATGATGNDRFFVTDTEVSLKQFRQFLTDEEYEGVKPHEVKYSTSKLDEHKDSKKDLWQYDERYFPNSDYPVVRISARSAAMYCNWLSAKNGRSAYYSFSKDPFSFESVPGSNGFRLPTETEGNFLLEPKGQFLGKDVEKDWYSAYVSNYEFEPDVDGANFETGCRLPNCCGLFDSVGNVNEICVSFEPKSGQLVSTSHSGIGSHEPMSAMNGKSQLNRKRKPTSHSAKAGFRVVLQMKK